VSPLGPEGACDEGQLRGIRFAVHRGPICGLRGLSRQQIWNEGQCASAKEPEAGAGIGTVPIRFNPPVA